MSSHDPFAPHTAAPTAAPSLPQTAAATRAHTEPLPTRSHLEEMRKADLVALCERRGVTYADTDTRLDLIEALERDR